MRFRGGNIFAFAGDKVTDYNGDRITLFVSVDVGAVGGNLILGDNSGSGIGFFCAPTVTNFTFTRKADGDAVAQAIFWQGPFQACISWGEIWEDCEVVCPCTEGDS